MSPNPTPPFHCEPTGDAPEPDLQSLREELDRCVFRGVGGFYAKYFEDQSWSAALEQAMQNVQPAETSRLCNDFLDIRSLESLVAWLTRFRAIFLAEKQIHYHFLSRHISNPGDPLRASIYLVASDQSEPDSRSVTANTRVFGEYNTIASSSDSEDVLRFCESARQIFQAQPTRRFLHGFQICGSMAELWVFDRSGVYSCERLNIEQTPDLLIKTIAGYTLMDDGEAGLSTFIRLQGLGRYVAFPEVQGGDGEEFYLEREPIAAPDYLIGPVQPATRPGRRPLRI